MHPRRTLDIVRPSAFHAGFRRTALRGWISIGAALLVLLWPRMALNALVVGVGAYLCADGAMMLWLAVTEPRLRASMSVRGTLALVVGVLAVAYSSMTLLALVFAVGSWGVITGCLELWIAYRFKHLLVAPGLWASVGVVSLAFGLVFLAWPEPGRLVLAILLGAYGSLSGIAMLLLASRLRTRELGGAGAKP